MLFFVSFRPSPSTSPQFIPAVKTFFPSPLSPQQIGEWQAEASTPQPPLVIGARCRAGPQPNPRPGSRAQLLHLGVKGELPPRPGSWWAQGTGGGGERAGPRGFRSEARMPRIGCRSPLEEGGHPAGWLGWEAGREGGKAQTQTQRAGFPGPLVSHFTSWGQRVCCCCCL